MEQSNQKAFAKKRSWSAKRTAPQKTAVSVDPGSLVRCDFLHTGQRLPLVVEPNIGNLQITDWIGANPQWIETRLLQHGGILFRGCAVDSQDDFERLVETACPNLMTYMEGATPRTQLSKSVYTSTEFPPELTIELHNELSYVLSFPRKIWFFCLQPPARGGETPIADMRRVFNRIPSEIRERFQEKGWMLVRNFGEGFGPTWRDAYHIEERHEVEQYFHDAAVSFEWKDNGGERLRTTQVRPAVLEHPATKEMVWFNHVAFWHVSSLSENLRGLLLSDFAEDELPYNTFYGDGSTIEDSVIATIRDAYREETIAFPWEHGDVLMLDNILVAHGRNPFQGTRRVLTAMGPPFTRTDV